MTKDEVTIKIEKTKCCFCGGEFVTAEQHDANFTRYKHDSWVGLTDDEIQECFKITPDQHLPWHIYQRIEAKLREKNT